MRDDEVDRVLGYVAKGLTVRIIGAPGSGRTRFAREVTAKLEDDGVALYSMFAAPALASVPFAGILALGLDIRSRTVGVLGMADLLSADLARTESPVIIIDDVDSLDKESLAVVNIVRTRTKVPLVITMNDRPFHPKSPAGALGSIADATVRLTPLGYAQVNRLMASMLGAPAEVDVVAHVLTKSGGNVRLAVRIIETAVLSERLVLKDGRWCMSGDGLMNEHLHGAVEALFHGLRAEEIRALRKISLLGPTPVSRLVTSIGEEALDNLEAYGLISVVSGPDGAPLATVFPPIVDDYLHAHTFGSKRILHSAVASHVGQDSEERQQPDATDDLLSSAASTLRSEMGSNHAASTRYFQQRLETMERLHYQAWDNQPTVANAVKLLSIYWGAPADTQRLQEIFHRTDTRGYAVEDLFFFSMTLSWWTYGTGHDLPGALAVMHTLASDEPKLASEAAAFAEFLERISGNRPTIQAAQTIPTTHDSDITAILQAAMELFSLRPQRALDVLPSATNHPHLHRFEAFISGLGVLFTGHAEKALDLALKARQQALEAVDQFGFVSHSYIAALSLLHHGLFDEAEYLMGRAFSLGRPGLLVDALHTAMLGLSSLRDIGAGAPLENPKGAREVGPLPGTGTALQLLAASRPVSAKAFDHDACLLVKKSLENGFALEAMHTAMFALGLLPGPRLLEVLHRILADSDITAHRQFLAIADAAVVGDLTRLRDLLATYIIDGDTYQIAMLLRGAEQRWQLSGEPTAATELRRAGKEFMDRFQPMGTIINFRSEPPGSSLTLREIEVAMLAGQQSNQDIAEHFGISIRTVESHISNALRKTDTTTRRQLADLIQNVPRAVLSSTMEDFQGHDTTRFNAISGI